jgi:hypothetical protein
VFREQLVALLKSELGRTHAREKCRELMSELEERRVLIHINIERISKGRAEAKDAAIAAVHDLGRLGRLGLHGEDAGCGVVLFCRE